MTDRRTWIGVGSVVLLIAALAGLRVLGGRMTGGSEVPPPDLAWAAPSRAASPPFVLPEVGELTQCRDVLESVVRKHALVPDNPWAVEHALIALGPSESLSNGEPAIDFLFAEYADEVATAGETLVEFPTSRSRPGKPDIRIEPHTDLILSGLAQLAVDPATKVTVDGKPHTVEDLYRHSLFRTWVDGERLSAKSWDDTPWTLISLAAYAPPGAAWTAEGGHPMTMDGYTHAVVRKLHGETQFLRDAMAAGTVVKKQKQGIFAYTCGGAHLLQGAAFAVARGFGDPSDKASIQAEIPALYYRYGVEMKAVDDAIQKNPDFQIKLLSQRLKFLGHFLESTERLSAMGFYAPDDAQQKILQEATAQTCATAAVLQQKGVFDNLDRIREKDEQTYLDFVGDSAHALRGMDYVLGRRKVIY